MLVDINGFPLRDYRYFMLLQATSNSSRVISLSSFLEEEEKTFSLYFIIIISSFVVPFHRLHEKKQLFGIAHHLQKIAKQRFLSKRYNRKTNGKIRCFRMDVGKGRFKGKRD